MARRSSKSSFAAPFPARITFFVGENGSGKSTLLEAIALVCGFHAGGGSHHHHLYANDDRSYSRLADALRPAWLPKVNKLLQPSGLHRRCGDVLRRAEDACVSHGESFLAVFTQGFDGANRSIPLMDEPEAALSPSRQLAFLAVLRDLEVTGNVQAIIATHSPILLSFPGATLYSFDGPRIEPTTLDATEHYRVTKASSPIPTNTCPRSSAADPIAH